MVGEFKVGDKVTWVSQAGGHTKVKTGVVEEVVTPGGRPSREAFESLYTSNGIGAPRKHLSYVVRVPGATSKAAGAVYWPRAASLQPAPEDVKTNSDRTE
ncbi:hypothetical protein BLA39750_01096 [Burkholderia lata]|uniref:Hypervirulence associated protein TUDOR domain-containing protein n=1 Tax=Burkholderia lata (strain ATCC 17760 / DSM 23089 / LMG 22485 / NCIMB 9086 / R18194 / 383) TaxID=482957 RepID=A0A6P2UWE4_BURL3|nr:hypothetical protein BLA39750_01096 [Burkholderia lata]